MTPEEKARERARRWYEQNKQRRAEYDRNRYQDPERRLAGQLRGGLSRARQAGVEADPITSQQLLEHWRATGVDELRCYITGAELTPENRSIDHRVPISRGGAHALENLFPCTYAVNNRKQNKLPEELSLPA